MGIALTIKNSVKIVEKRLSRLAKSNARLSEYLPMKQNPPKENTVVFN